MDHLAQRADEESGQHVTVSIGRINIDYYLDSAAAGDAAQIGTRDLTAYYTETQAPPGRWFGKGLDAVGLVNGQQVTKWVAKSIYEQFVHPETGKELGARPIQSTTAPEGAQTPIGNAARSEREAVAGFDLTFSVPKSVSVLWALAEPKLQADLAAAHQQAVEECMDWLERNVIQARAGHGGVAWVAVEGVVASMFDHWDSRVGDPQLHTHAVIANRVCRISDGKWVTLDSYTLHRHMVAVSEKYNSILFDRIYERTGAVAELRAGIASLTGTDAEGLLEQLGEPGSDPVNPRAELAGIADALITEFSARSLEITSRTDELVARWVEQHGIRPPQAVLLKMRQEATLATRSVKMPSTESLPEKMIGWRQRTLDSGHRPADIVRDAVGHDVPVITNADIGVDVVKVLGRHALYDTSSRRTTFTRANLVASTERILRGVRMGSVIDREALVDRVVEAAAVQAVTLSPERMSAPEFDDPFLTVRGRSVFEHEETKRFTTAQIIDDEAFLISRTAAPVVALPSGDTAEVLHRTRTREGLPLSPDQAAAAATVLSSGRAIDAIIGPAGTGKTTTMRAIRQLWEAAHGKGSVIGLAPSAVAAAVLGEEIDAATDNVAKWLYESVGDGAARRVLRVAKLEERLTSLGRAMRQAPRRSPARRRIEAQLRLAQSTLAAQYAEQAKYRMRPGQLVILDEASMVGTAAAAELARQAETAGAKILLVGDPAQLDAVEAGGFLGWMERHTDAPVLSSVWRFAAEWERTASLRLRTGDVAVLQAYAEHGRIIECSEGSGADLAYQAWMADTSGDASSSLLIAGDNETVNDLNLRAQLDLAAAGRVDLEATVPLRTGIAGKGDIILARQNNRRLTDDAGHFIKNGTRLVIQTIHSDGSITAARTDTGAAVVLDPGYLETSVELGYACTAHRSQGVTVDTAHTVASSGQSRELFYVAMTRGRHGNTCYVDIPEPEEDTPDEWGMVRRIMPTDATAILHGVLGNQGQEMSAHEVRDAEHGHANDFARLIFEYDYTATADRTGQVIAWLRATVPDRALDVMEDPLFLALVRAEPHSRLPAGFDVEAASVKDFIAACRPAPDPGEHVGGGITSRFTPATPETAAVETQLREKISARLHHLVPSADGEEIPGWVAQLRQDHPDAPDFPALLCAVTAWREVSGQQDSETPWGQAPKPTDKTMTGYYDAARRHLPPAQLPSHGEPEDVWANVSLEEDTDRLVRAEQLMEHLPQHAPSTARAVEGAETDPWADPAPAALADPDSLWDL